MQKSDLGYLLPFLRKKWFFRHFFDKLWKAVNIGDLVKRNEYRRRALRRAKNEEEKLRNVESKEAHLRKMTEMSEEEIEAEKAARQLQTLKVAPKVAKTKKQEKKQNVTDLDSLLDDL